VSTAGFSLSIFGLQIEYTSSKNELKCLESCAPAECYDGYIDLRILIDTITTEIYINGGKASMCMSHIQDYNINKLELKAIDNNVVLKELKIAKLENAWKS
jgi:sucrose-6-phosphate hydrolase SacC (GH32 family)